MNIIVNSVNADIGSKIFIRLRKLTLYNWSRRSSFLFFGINL